MLLNRQTFSFLTLKTWTKVAVHAADCIVSAGGKTFSVCPGWSRFYALSQSFLSNLQDNVEENALSQSFYSISKKLFQVFLSNFQDIVEENAELVHKLWIEGKGSLYVCGKVCDVLFLCLCLFPSSMLNSTPDEKRTPPPVVWLGQISAMINLHPCPHTHRVVQVAMARGVQERLQEIVAKVSLRVWWLSLAINYHDYDCDYDCDCSNYRVLGPVPPSGRRT